MNERMISDVPGSGLVCPRCEFEQPAAAECARCGVVFAKLRDEGRRPAGPPSASPQSQAAAPAETRGSGRLLGWLVMLLLVVAAVAVFPRNRPAPPPEPAAAMAEATEAAKASPAMQTAAAPAPSPMPAPSPEISPELAVPEPLSAAPSEPSPEPAVDSTPVRMPFSWYAGAQGYRQAMDEANAGGRAVAVYFYTDWCPYCRRLDGDLLQSSQVQDYFQSVVKVKINPESGPAERELSDRYGVTGYPTFFIETPATGRTREIEAFTQDGGGWRIRTPEEFVGLCRRAAAG